jgi:GR25 family glycosyltransferase involved in LPS biosynthesis
MSHIDVIFYINLESRKDRKEHFLNEITKITSDNTKLIRIDAVKEKLGILGCVYSHIKAIEEFQKNPEWNTCIIFEDDFTFKNDNREINNNNLTQFFNEFPEWDMLTLSYNPNEFVFQPTHKDNYVKVLRTQTTSGYCLNKKFSSVLKNNFIESSELLKKRGSRCHEYSLDIYWQKLQPTSNWFAVRPALGYQYSNFSDIENSVTDYKC